jgi:hypothetical protein
MENEERESKSKCGFGGIAFVFVFEPNRSGFISSPAIAKQLMGVSA